MDRNVISLQGFRVLELIKGSESEFFTMVNGPKTNRRIGFNVVCRCLRA